MSQLVIGLGEVGSSILNVLNEHYEDVKGHDQTYTQLDLLGCHQSAFDFFHICFPYSDNFVEEVKGYCKDFLKTNGLIIIHSTVPIGTCEKLDAVSSPIRGIHPNLEKGIKTFVKYFGGKRAYEASKIFEACNIQTKVYDSSRDVEAGKIVDTAYFGWIVAFNKEIYKMCQEKGLNFEIVWSEFTKTYNDGYRALDKDKFARPYFEHISGPIGGHCVMNNLKFLDNYVSFVLEKINERHKSV